MVNDQGRISNYADIVIQWFESVLTQLHYISFLATCSGFYKTIFKANDSYGEVHSVCTYIMGSQSVYINYKNFENFSFKNASLRSKEFS